ncbi:MAG: SusC/RagA family TonB-linked outer membrane protein, partial [Sphingobacteriales bacterium]
MRKKSFSIKPVLCMTIGLQILTQVAFSQNGYVYATVHKSIPNQQKTDSDKMPEKADKQTLSAVLKELNRSKGIFFLYSDHALGNKIVNPANDKEANIEKILDQVLKNTGLKFKKISDKTFVILEKKETYKPDNTVNFNETDASGANVTNVTIEAVAGMVKGRVTGDDGTPVAGASIVVKGTKNGTQTNSNGEFSVQASKGDVLVFSSVGFLNKEVQVGDSDEINITLTASSRQLSEVVVTALGIQRKAKSLTYSTQKISGSELSAVKDANVINGLAGKAAGVTITRSTSGVGGSARVILRGNKSTRENQPLYVIDGVPVANFSPGQPTDVWGQSSGAGSGGRDGGDGISNINPDDIESINILKGASASALYGSQAANGVILITTKKGKSGGRVEFSSNYTIETPLLKPDLQYRYGQTTDPVTGAKGATIWGAKVNAPDHVKDFWRTGGTWINSISLSAGNQSAQTYFSYSNTTSKGIEPTSKFDRHTLNLRETMKLFNDKLSIDANVTVLTQKNHNRAVSGMYNNPLTGLYLFPRGLDFSSYKNNYEYFSPSRNMNLQNWWNINYDQGMGGDDNQQNPYWSLYRNLRDDSRDRGLASLSLKYSVTNWLSIQARGNFDKSFDKYELKSYAGTQSVLAALNGRYTLERATNSQLYGDLIATATQKLSSQINLVANIGTSILGLKGKDGVFFDTDPTAYAGLGYANKFNVANILPNSLNSTASMDRKQVQSIFASTQFSYHDYLFLDLTARNDWSSTLAFTPSVNKGFIYYSAGLTGV